MKTPKLESLGYVDGRSGQEGANLDTYGLSEYHFNLGKVINLYDNKTVKYAGTTKNLKLVIKDSDFLK